MPHFAIDLTRKSKFLSIHFSINLAWSRGLLILPALMGAIVGGAVLSPALLPWLPGRAFSVKGGFPGLAIWLVGVIWLWRSVSVGELTALLLLVLAGSSFLAMNFTGSTPYTSPTGVETEMKRAIPVQAVSLLVAIIMWVWVGF